MKKVIISILTIILLIPLLYSCVNEDGNIAGVPSGSNTLGIYLKSSHQVSTEKFHYEFILPVYNGTTNSQVGWQFKDDPFNTHKLTGTPDNNYILATDLFNGSYFINFGVYEVDPVNGDLVWDYKNSEWFNNPKNPYRKIVDGEVFFAFNVVNGKMFAIPNNELPKLKATIRSDKGATQVNAIINFDGSTSTVSDINQWSIIDYAWKLGDGALKKGEKITHFYQQEGIYTVKLTITAVNNQGVEETAVAEKEIIISMPDLPVIGQLIYVDDLTRVSYNEEADGIYIYIFCDLLPTEGPQEHPFFSGNFAGEDQKWILIDAQFLSHNNRWAYVKHRFDGNHKYYFNYGGNYYGWYHQEGTNWLTIDGANWNHYNKVKPLSYNGYHQSLHIINNKVVAQGFF